MALAEVVRDEVDGVPVFWSPEPGPLTAGLVFRVGRADEQAVAGGVTHLVEHLALAGLDPVLQEYNGRVDALTTTFTVSGPPQDVCDVLGRVCRALHALPAARLEPEKRVLEAEAAGRGRGLHSTLLVHRFGPRGHGLPAYAELGLKALDAPQVQAWASGRFTRGAAALWLSGPPPDGLRLELPPGQAQPPPDVHAVPALPGWLTDDETGLSLLLERGPATNPALELLQQRLWQRLRTQEAVVYDVQVRAQLVAPRQRLVDVQVDPRPEDAEQAARGLREELDRLCEDGPSQGALQAVLAVGARHRTEAGAGGAWASVCAVDALLGEPVRSLAQVDADARSVRPEDVREVLRRGATTALWALPPGSRPLHLAPVDLWSPDRVDGPRLQPSAGYADSTTALVLGPDGATEEVDTDKRVTVRYDRCVALLQWDDGSRVLWGDDGFRLPLAPWEWQGGDQLVGAVDAGVPAALHVRMGEGEGAPAPPAPTSPPRPGAGRLVGLTVAWLFVLFCLALVLTAPIGIDPETGEDVPCGSASSLQVWRDGSEAPVAGRDACQQAAREDVLFGLVGVVVLAAALPLTGLLVRDYARARTSATTSATPS